MCSVNGCVLSVVVILALCVAVTDQAGCVVVFFSMLLSWWYWASALSGSAEKRQWKGNRLVRQWRVYPFHGNFSHLFLKLTFQFWPPISLCHIVFSHTDLGVPAQHGWEVCIYFCMCKPGIRVFLSVCMHIRIHTLCSDASLEILFYFYFLLYFILLVYVWS